MDFETACEEVKSFSKMPSDGILLEFYGLYKQATVGDCNIPEPDEKNLKAKAKYDAWKKHKGMLKIVARSEYVDLYLKYAPRYE